MQAQRPLELLFVMLVAACGGGRDDRDAEELDRSAQTLDVTMPATALGIDDAVFRRVDSQPLVVCPPGAPFLCRSQDAAGWACSEMACAPSCEKIGCPGAWACIDCGAGPECAPPSHECR